MDPEAMSPHELQIEHIKATRTMTLSLHRIESLLAAGGTPEASKRKRQAEPESDLFETEHMTKQIKQALCKHMIHECFMGPSRETTDKALAEAAGKPVLELLKNSPAYASYKQKLADNIRDIRGDINKEVKNGVKLASGSLVAPRDNQDPRVPQQTADDGREAQRLLIGEAYRKSCYGPAGNTQTDEYGRQQFRLATAIAWAPGAPHAQRRDGLPDRSQEEGFMGIGGGDSAHHRGRQSGSREDEVVHCSDAHLGQLPWASDARFTSEYDGRACLSVCVCMCVRMSTRMRKDVL
ncbi:hypothetical protein CVIRNUC_000217 [Coccomyxa viridis]|uniref:TFIIS central domain-containing protein n=1 Tax=Coccomyxa viridis TaxID=1274662 RepID=A0AAV1HPX4_9CHLO|nr:hypothetical protein CVIRNUC_000217 [Coccomyxa viridis]